LILVARRADKVRELARTLTTRTGRSVETIAADLTQGYGFVRHCVASATMCGHSIWLVAHRLFTGDGHSFAHCAAS
jgi:hypothetical protein